MTKNALSQPILVGELPPHSDNKNVVSQVRRYNGWLANTGRRLYQPDLVAYRDHLLAALAPASVKRICPASGAATRPWSRASNTEPHW